MDFIAAIGLDIAALAVVLYCAKAAARKGFVRTVIQMIAYIVVLVMSSFFSNAAAPVIYDRIVEPMLLENVRYKAQPQTEQYQNAALISAAPHGMLSLAEDAAGSLDFLEKLAPEGINPQGLADDLIDDIAQAALRPVMIGAIGMISFAILFALLSMLANILLSALGIINHLPVIGPLNAALGGAVGILQGLLIVWILALLLQGFLYLYPNGWWIFRSDVLSQSYVLKYFMDVDLLRKTIQSL